MTNVSRDRPSVALDVVFAIVIACIHVGAVMSGVGPSKSETGSPPVWACLYMQFLGALFVASYYFPRSSYLLRGLMWCCENTSSPRGAWTALLWGPLAFAAGSLSLLTSLGIVPW